MQQTQKYKLNLIESSDPFMPEGLNQNTQKVEQVLAAQEAANDQKLAAVAGRVTALEAHRFVIGSYQGDSAQTRFVPLGFTPLLVIVSADPYPHFAATGVGDMFLSIVEGGIQVCNYSPAPTNSVGTHAYVAFV